MPRFVVVTTEGAGDVTPTREISAPTAEAAEASVRRRGLTPVRVAEIGEASVGSRVIVDPLAREGAILRSARVLEVLGHYLRESGDASTVLSRAITAHPGLRTALGPLRDATASGMGLALAVEAHGQALGPLVLEVVRAGQAHGRLADACTEAAEILRKHRPLALRAILLTSNLWLDIPTYAIPVVAVGLVLAAVAAVGAGALALTGRSPKRAWHALRFRLPLVGGLFRAMVFSRFLQVFAALMRVGAPVGRSLELALAATGDANLMADALPGLALVREGEPVSRALLRSERFPRGLIDIIATGEKTGRMDAACGRLSEYLRDDAEEAVDRVAGHALWVLPALVAVPLLVAMLVVYGRMAPGGLPSPGEMWHNLFHGPGTRP